jgi:ribosomal-protein-alanine N-acetyltransferase
MRPWHLDQVYQIELDSFVIPWTRRDFEKELKNNLAIYIVALENTEVIGYAGMWHVVNEGHIVNVAVKEGKRRRGVGSELIKRLTEIALEKEMMGLTLEVRMSNAAGQRLYHKFGFKAEGIRGRYYSDTGEDAIIMWKYLDGR